MDAQEGTPINEVGHTKNQMVFGKNDLITIILLVFLFPIGVIAMWFATKWPKWIKFLITIPFILGIVGLIVAILFLNVLTKNDLHDDDLPKAPDQVVCSLEAMLCPDGVTYVGREGPNCEFQECPTIEQGNSTPSSEVIELPETSSEIPAVIQEEILPTVPAG